MEDLVETQAGEGGPAAAGGRPGEASCRFCDAPLERTMLDLGLSPLANSYVQREALNRPELFYPLKVSVCEKCFLVQLPELESAEAIFSDYAYFSSYSDSWLAHAESYARRTIELLSLDDESLVVEVASNDGYLLRYFAQAGIPVLGIEPAANVAVEAEKVGVPTRVRFFGDKLAAELLKEGKRPDLIVANNVLAHVPDLNDFVAGLKRLLAPQGVLTVEFPHLLRLMDEGQFDTIYHEHFSYFSLSTARRIFAHHGLTLFDVEELPTHGGSLRISGRHALAQEPPAAGSVRHVLDREQKAGLDDIATYDAFAERAHKVKRDLVRFLFEARERGKSVAGYGAPAKGNTLLNYCGIRTDLVAYTVDRSPHKQGTCLPGTRIPVYAPDRLRETRPDYVLILPWNLKEEIMSQMHDVVDWGGRFVLAVPELTVLPSPEGS